MVNMPSVLRVRFLQVLTPMFHQLLTHPVSEAVNTVVIPIQRSLLPQRIRDLLPTDPSVLSVYMDDYIIQMVDNLVEENEELDITLGELADDKSGWVVENNDEDFDFDSNLWE